MKSLFKCMNRGENASTISIKSKCFDRAIVFNLEDDALVIEVLDVLKKKHESVNKKTDDAQTKIPLINK